MNRATTEKAMVQHFGSGARWGGWWRLSALALMAVLVVPLLLAVTSGAAFADDDEDRNDYSLYQLASNASTYFGEENSPEGDNMADGEWGSITGNPATAGSMLGYADPDFSVGKVTGWLFTEMSGSSQTISYETLQSEEQFSGLVDYAHFGAANRDLGLDGMSTGIGGQIISAIGGSVIWAFYALAISVAALFWVIISFLQLINPFKWFYLAVARTPDGDPVSNLEKADAMVGGESSSWLMSLQLWVADWYGLLTQIAWQALVPLFIGFLLIGLVLVKNTNRGSAIKKLIVRLVFIGVGVPLIGSLYTAVLDKFDDSMVGQHAGPTRVVLSTYVDFESWLMNDRLAVPGQATIAWDDGQASAESRMRVRTSALAINTQANPAWAGISVSTQGGGAEDAWRDGISLPEDPVPSATAMIETFGLINKYISSRTVAAADFESGIKTSLTHLDWDTDDKQKLFIDNNGGYGSPKEFGERADTPPTEHPMISVTGGLTSSQPGADSTTFTTANLGQATGCRFAVGDADAIGACNLAPLAAYNYLNTGFGPDALDLYSSNNATSGFTRENHLAVSQVGTGPAKFLYWSNAAVVLGCIVVLGFWYALGMLVGALKRMFALVAAIPFATLGALQAIAKVLTYSAALILEIIITLFLYQFVSAFLISLPDILAGPMSFFAGFGGPLGDPVFSGIAVGILTLLSSLLVIGVTFALMRVRKVVLQALDEAVTKLVDKFLDTTTPPRAEKPGGLMPALANGVGAGAGMAAGNKLAGALGHRAGGGSGAPPATGNRPGGTPVPTNAGGTNGGVRAVTGRGGLTALGAGPGPGGSDPDGSGGPGGGDGPHGVGGGDSDQRVLTRGPSNSDGSDGGRGADGRHGASESADGSSSGGALVLAGYHTGGAHADRALARQVANQGGLSNLGYHTNGTGSLSAPGRGAVLSGQIVDSSKGPQRTGQGGDARTSGRSSSSVPQTSGGRGNPAAVRGAANVGTVSSNASTGDTYSSGAGTKTVLPQTARTTGAPTPYVAGTGTPSTRTTRPGQGRPASVSQVGVQPVAVPAAGQPTAGRTSSESTAASTRNTRASVPIHQPQAQPQGSAVTRETGATPVRRPSAERPAPAQRSEATQAPMQAAPENRTGSKTTASRQQRSTTNGARPVQQTTQWNQPSVSPSKPRQDKSGKPKKPSSRRADRR